MINLDSAPLAVLFVGGTGTISASSVRRAIASGMAVFVLNRGNNAKSRELPDAVRTITADINDSDSVTAALGDLTFDVVVNFLTFDAKGAERAIDLFRGKTKHYIHISTASLYGKPVLQVPIVESTPIHNRFVAYSRAKIGAEDAFQAAYKDTGFPVTIVRPSHTYDDANPPVPGDWTVFDRIERGAEIVVHGDGTSLWTLTHARDFAVGFVGLMGNPVAVGDSFQITSDFVYPWDAIYRMLGSALGVEPTLVHVASETIAAAMPDWGPGLIGDKSHSVIFDNSKLRGVVPDFNPTTAFAQGAREIVAWYDADESRRSVDAGLNATLDALIARA
jgi:nucleoside-diphosphate-sugar epimerase